MRHQDFGGDFRLMAQEIGLKGGRDIFWPEMEEGSMPGPEIINEIYNATDLLISTTGGEGWGLSTTEAMACKVPVVVPNHTALTEIISDDRGYLANAGTSPNLWCNRGSEYFNLWCPQVDVEFMVKQMKQAYDKKEQTKMLVENAYKWVQTLKWETLALEWEKLFENIEWKK
jgi:glycosyltransferase involved in cell wall biosynthesis